MVGDIDARPGAVPPGPPVVRGRAVPGPCEGRLLGTCRRWAPIAGALSILVCGAVGLLGTPDGVVPILSITVLVAVVPLLGRERNGRRPAWAAPVGGVVIGLPGVVQCWPGIPVHPGWVAAVVGIGSVTCHFEWSDRPRVGVLMGVIGIGSYAIGTALDAGVLPAATVSQFAIQSALTWCALRMLRRAAAASDRDLDSASERRVAVALADARRRDEDAHLALLHDTASTTLLMVSTGAPDRGWLRKQAVDDFELLTRGVADLTGSLDLAALLSGLADHAGLRARVELPDPMILPAEPVVAIYLGVREALANVGRHTADRQPSVCCAADGCGVRVTVADRGAGFDPDDVDPRCRGLSQSIVARMVAAGGSTSIRSSPEGTVVCWRWSP